MATNIASNQQPHLIYFQSLFQHGRGFAFPCDAAGQVDMDAMTEHTRANYLFARAMIGREFAFPCVRGE
jgi:hypothetical protein